MELLNFLSYVISGSICFILAIMLLFANNFFETPNLSYNRAKRYLAYSAIIDVMANCLAVSCYLAHKDVLILDKFIFPLVYFAQLSLTTGCILDIVRSKRLTLRNVVYYNIPLFFSFVAYICTYVFWAGSNVFSLNTYIAFFHSSVSDYLSVCIYIIIIAEAVFSIVISSYETLSYRKKLFNIYSGKVAEYGNKLSYLIYAYIAYFILAAADFLLPSITASTILVFVNTAIFTLSVICILNLQYAFTRINLIDEEENAEEETTDVIAEPSSISTKVTEWATRSDKPYLNDNLTLIDAAMEMKISSRRLSDYLNKECNINFNNWINTLRIEEVKRMLKEDKNITLKEIAFATGFSSGENLSKVFKKITGIAPTAYKDNL